jgi:hypothetical protein
MKKTIHKIKTWIKNIITKLNNLPPYIKLPIWIFLVIFGAINIINPFINWVFLIIIWVWLITSAIPNKKRIIRKIKKRLFKSDYFKKQIINTFKDKTKK